MLPPPRSPAQLSNGDNEDLRLRGGIDDREFESMSAAFPDAFHHARPALRMFADVIDRRINLVEEMPAESWALGFEVSDAREEILLRTGKESKWELHAVRFLRTS